MLSAWKSSSDAFVHWSYSFILILLRVRVSSLSKSQLDQFYLPNYYIEVVRLLSADGLILIDPCFLPMMERLIPPLLFCLQCIYEYWVIPLRIMYTSSTLSDDAKKRYIGGISLVFFYSASLCLCFIKFLYSMSKSIVLRLLLKWDTKPLSKKVWSSKFSSFFSKRSFNFFTSTW